MARELAYIIIALSFIATAVLLWRRTRRPTKTPHLRVDLFEEREF
jgi:hypothetical protein